MQELLFNNLPELLYPEEHDGLFTDGLRDPSKQVSLPWFIGILRLQDREPEHPRHVLGREFFGELEMIHLVKKILDSLLRLRMLGLIDVELHRLESIIEDGHQGLNLLLIGQTLRNPQTHHLVSANNAERILQIDHREALGVLPDSLDVIKRHGLL